MRNDWGWNPSSPAIGHSQVKPTHSTPPHPHPESLNTVYASAVKMPKEDRCVLGLKCEGRAEEERKGLSNACYSKGSNEASPGEGPIFLLKKKQRGNGGGGCDGHPSNRDSATEPRNTRIEARPAL